MPKTRSIWTPAVHKRGTQASHVHRKVRAYRDKTALFRSREIARHRIPVRIPAGDSTIRNYLKRIGVQRRTIQEAQTLRSAGKRKNSKTTDRASNLYLTTTQRVAATLSRASHTGIGYRQRDISEPSAVDALADTRAPSKKLETSPACSQNTDLTLR